MRRTTALSLLAAAVLSGVTLGRFGYTASFSLLVAAAVVALTLAWSRFRFLGAMGLLLVFGLYQATMWAHERAQLAALVAHKVTVTGVIADDPSTGTKGGVDFKLGNMELADGTRLPGTISVHQYPSRLQRGFRVQLTGKVRPGFGQAAAQLSFAKLTVLSREQSWLEHLRQNFFAGMRTALPEPLASFGLGLLVGIRSLIPKDLQAELTLVGLSHLVAVSGYNLTIIVAAVERTLGRFGRGIALVSSLWLIAGFLVVTGASASIVRAALVSVLGLVAAFYGRRFHPLVLILGTAAATAAWNPGYLTDLGWLLSYLAFFGILVLAPAIEARLGHPRLVVARLFIESTAAQITTLPLLLFFFGQLSVISPLTNLIILPMVPLAMATGFVAGVAGMVVPAFCGWLAWPAHLLLWFMMRLVDACAALPWAGRADHLDVWGMLAAYAVVVGLSAVLWHRTRAARKTKGPRRRLTDVATS